MAESFERANAGEGVRYVTRVLSMPRAIARLERIAANLDEAQVSNWSFFDALPPEQVRLNYDDLTAFRRFGSVLSPGELSCAASHIAMIKQFLASEVDYLAVIEDDVFFDPFADLQNYAGLMRACGIDYLKLAARYFVPARFIGNIGRTSLYRASWPPLGTQCYLLSRAGAADLLNAFDKSGIYAPIDQMMDRFWQTGLPVVMAYPFPALEMAQPTMIHGDRSPLLQRNEALRMTMGNRPSKAQHLAEKLSRYAADKRMKSFDARIRQRLNASGGITIRSFGG